MPETVCFHPFKTFLGLLYSKQHKCQSVPLLKGGDIRAKLSLLCFDLAVGEKLSREAPKGIY